MDHPTSLILQDVRCFEGETVGHLRPITLLVGENSTGKTTFLGCYSALHRMLSRRFLNPTSVDFNDEPFAMGSFRDIVRARRGRGGRIREFSIGLAFDGSGGPRPPYGRLTATFCEEGSQPIVSCLRFDFNANEGTFLELHRNDDNETDFVVPGYRVRSPFYFDHAAIILRNMAQIHEMQDSDLTLSDVIPVLDYLAGIGVLRNLGKRSGARQPPSGLHVPVLSALNAIAPLRSKPKRTYDPVRETASAEGEHVPMLMMRLDRTDKEHWAPLHDDLVAFGRDAGLFSEIKVKRHGKQLSDPFQLQVKIRSSVQANLMDVGYGVSQSLPILVDIMAGRGQPGRGSSGARERTFLLQQPEVHLHPRGQAALASLFVDAVQKRRDRFLIETHSDFIVDRVRIAVRQSKIKAKDVAILYFEPGGNAVTIHNLRLDEAGNLIGAPAGYRDFFLRETDKLLGFVD